MNFSILTTLPLVTGYPILGAGGWGGSKLLCVLQPLCLDLDLVPEKHFLVYRPSNPWRVPRPTSGYPQSPSSMALAGDHSGALTLDWLF